MVGISRNMIALNSLNWRNYNSRSFFSEECGYDKIFDRKMELLLYGEADYYDILTGTVPDCRRKGISRAIFEKVKTILKEKQVELYTTEVKRNNTIAWNLYQSLGFEIKKEVVTIINTPHGSREVEQYEIMMKI